jgi:copper chaperone/Cu+-exporting ATPase
MSVFNDPQLLESVKADVLAISGVQKVDINTTAGRVFEVTFDGDANVGNQIAVHIGMHFNGQTVSYLENVGFFIRVEGMTCGSCTETVRRASAHIEGVKFCLVELKKELCGVVMARDICNVDAVVAAIEDVGFDAKAAISNKV